MTCIKTQSEGEGAASWVALLNEYEPDVAGRHLGMLCEILEFSIAPQDDVSTKLNDLDNKLKRYEDDSKEEVKDKMRIGILQRSLTSHPDLQKHYFHNTDAQTGERLYT